MPSTMLSQVSARTTQPLFGLVGEIGLLLVIEFENHCHPLSVLLSVKIPAVRVLLRSRRRAINFILILATSKSYPG